MEPQKMFIGGKWTEGSEKKIGLELGGKSPNIIFVNASEIFPEFAGFRFPLLDKKIY